MAKSCQVLALSSRKSFQRLNQTGKRVRYKNLSLVYKFDDAQETVYVAYSVGKRVGKAVIRNKVKRRLRSLVRECSCQMPGGDYLVMVSPRVAEMSFDELRDELRAILPLRGGS